MKTVTVTSHVAIEVDGKAQLHTIGLLDDETAFSDVQEHDTFGWQDIKQNGEIDGMVQSLVDAANAAGIIIDVDAKWVARAAQEFLSE